MRVVLCKTVTWLYSEWFKHQDYINLFIISSKIGKYNKRIFSSFSFSFAGIYFYQEEKPFFSYNKDLLLVKSPN